MRVLVTGSSGLIGRALVADLEADGVEVTRLVRRAPQKPGEIPWDPVTGELDAASLEGFDAVVHLAGAGIGDKRWSDQRKHEIIESRVGPTTLLCERLAETHDKPDVLISASAIGFYGDRTESVTEADGPADPPDFLSEVCLAWEAATGAAEAVGIRTVHIRTGLVLAEKGGALGRLLLPFRLGVGGKLGSGETYWSWISIQDHIRAIRHLIDKPVTGPVNLTAPNPVTNAMLTKSLGAALRRPTIMPVPRFALELLLGKELAAALLFTSARVLPAKLEESGFRFEHPDIDSALNALFSS